MSYMNKYVQCINHFFYKFCRFKFTAEFMNDTYLKERMLKMKDFSILTIIICD